MRSKRGAMVVAALLFCPAFARAQSDQVIGKAIMHKDGSRTISVQDPSIRELQEITYDRQDILVTRRIFRLDNAGRALSGMVYDGGNHMLARVQFGFDNLGRMVEERTSNPTGQVIRRLIYNYDRNGTRLKPLAYNYDPSGQRAPVQTAARSSLVTPGVNNSTLSAGDRIDSNYRQATPPPQRSGAAGSSRRTGSRNR